MQAVGGSSTGVRRGSAPVADMATWRTAVASKFAQYYNVSALNPPPDDNVPVSSASEHLARVIKVLPASEVNAAYMRETGYRFPTLVPQGLVKLATPAETFTPAFVAQQIGMCILSPRHLQISPLLSCDHLLSPFQ